MEKMTYVSIVDDEGLLIGRARVMPTETPGLCRAFILTGPRARDIVEVPPYKARDVSHLG